MNDFDSDLDAGAWTVHSTELDTADAATDGLYPTGSIDLYDGVFGTGDSTDDDAVAPADQDPSIDTSSLPPSTAPGADTGVLPDIDLTETDTVDDPPPAPAPEPPAAQPEQPPAQPEAPAAQPEAPVTEPGDDPPAEDTMHGNPAEWNTNWFFQQLDGYCGPAVVGQLVAEYTGVVITDPQQMVDRAVELGLTVGGDPTGGMKLPGIEALLEDQGVPATITAGSMDDLRAMLDDGRGVIAMVDSGEVWGTDPTGTEDNTPDHVVVVAGIDDARGVVILSDPGNPDGNQFELPIDEFEDAWADSGQQMLVADAPDPDLVDTDTAAAVLDSATPRHTSVVIEIARHNGL